MNEDTIAGNWKQFKGKVKEQWGKLTDDDLDVIAGKRDQMVGRMQELYGIAKDEAEKQLSDWETRSNYRW
ncbi:MAG TPA: CsbD family protein [Ottowia sp.]|uniref:CsbD family protein n=1 Tax=Ottowia sp. TaxID=1898956 RepID=UPI002BA1228A|nr:CsbD family protein [Ottowia sp.]HRN07703.1 CsbD family protein [Ottowia sp.]